MKRTGLVFLWLCFLLIGGEGYAQTKELQESFLESGEELFNAGKFSEALTDFTEATHKIENCEECDSLNILALMQMGRCHTRLGAVEMAFEKYEMGALLAEENGFLIQATRCRINQGLELSKLGRTKSAELSILKALAIRKEKFGKSSTQYARVLVDLESVKSLAGGYHECQSLLEEAKLIYRENGLERNNKMGIALANEASLLLLMAKDTSEEGSLFILEKAEGVALEAFEIFRSNMRGAKYIPEVYGILAELALHSNKNELARSYFLKADSIYEAYVPDQKLRSRGKLQAQLGSLYLEEQDLDAAEQCFNKSLDQFGAKYDSLRGVVVFPENDKKGENPNLLIPLEGLARTLSQGSSFQEGSQNTLDEIFAYLDFAAELSNRLGGKFHDQDDREYMAKDMHQRMSTTLAICLSLDARLQGHGYREKALDYLEDARSFALKLKLQEAQAQRQDRIPIHIFQREAELRNEIAKGKILLKTTPDQYDDLSVQLSNWDRELNNLKAENFPDINSSWEQFDLEETKTFLGEEGAIIVEYFQGEEGWGAFGIGPSGVELISLDCPDLESRVRTYVNILKTSPSNRKVAYDELLQQGGELYQCLMEPLLNSEDLAAAEKIIIIPDGVLSYLPFGCLISKGGLRTDSARPRYLIQDKLIYYGWSRSLIKPWKKAAEAPGKVLALGLDFKEGESRGSDFGRQGIRSPLPNVKNEIEEISDFVETDVWFNEVAGEERFKREAKPYRILHFATHGEADLQNSELSVLHTYADNDEDGFLHAFEISGMSLDAELVVLSACQTAEGEWKRGEGVMSLGRAFAYAGCPSTVMSHWNVNDLIAPKLMANFYEGLSEGLLTSEALAIAKRNLIMEGNDPYFWGPFVLQGVDSRIRISKSTSSNWFWLGISAIALMILIGFLFKRMIL